MAEVVAKWTGIPVTRLMEGEVEKLIHMEERLHRRVIGQEEAVQAVSDALRRSRAGLSDPDRPIGTFLFLGPTGVGKTELARALAEFMFDSQDAMVRIDMSEYMEKHTVSRLVGAPPGYVGYEEGGQLTEAVRRRPYSVVLLDEIEKAHNDVFNVLLQVMDDGRLTDGQGRTVDFKNTVLIMTSNIPGGREGALATFKPEFINRLDDIVEFEELSREQLREIVDLQVSRLIGRVAERGVEIDLTDAARDLLGDLGYDPTYGARPLKRVISKRLVDPLALGLLKGEFAAGDRIEVDAADGELRFARSRPRRLPASPEGLRLQEDLGDGDRKPDPHRVRLRRVLALLVDLHGPAAGAGVLDRDLAAPDAERAAGLRRACGEPHGLLLPAPVQVVREDRPRLHEPAAAEAHAPVRRRPPRPHAHGEIGHARQRAHVVHGVADRDRERPLAARLVRRVDEHSEEPDGVGRRGRDRHAVDQHLDGGGRREVRPRQIDVLARLGRRARRGVAGVDRVQPGGGRGRGGQREGEQRESGQAPGDHDGRSIHSEGQHRIPPEGSATTTHMPTYIMLSTLTPEGVQTVKNNPSRIREVNQEVEQLGATVKAQWATLGHFDFVNIVEAPDEKTMARVSLELGSRGTAHYESLAAIPIDDFIASL